MANILKNKLYPYIQKYINEYLHGFSQEKIDIQLAKGEVTLEKMSLRPDTINKILDESNVPFWIKIGLIKKISLGASVLSVIGEIPLEVEIDGVDIILSPSYKWIINYINNYENNSQIKDVSSPLGNDIFNKKPDDFDLSIFNVEKIQEIFKDKTILSNVINSLFKALYSFYNSPNFVAVIKIKNVHIRFEDDELMNYTGDIALGMKVNLIQIKVGCKGNMKKNSIKLQNLDIYWENEAKILISSNFLNGCIVDGQLQEKYYTNLKNVRFERFQYLPTTKFIIQDFNFTMNLGTRIEKKGDIDIFDIQASPSMVYVQLASNELNINLYPEIAQIQNNFNEFLAQFPIIEKVKDFRPFIKPSELNSLKYIDLIENYRKNVIDDKNKNKMLVRDWINYIYWFEKSKKGDRKIQINPIRTEFVRFYNICIKKEDVYKKIKEKKKEEKKEEKKVEKKEEKEGMPMDREIPKEKHMETPGGTPMGDEKEEENNYVTPGGTPQGEETPTPGETPDGNNDELSIPNDFDFSSKIELLLKGININLNTPLNQKIDEYISLSIWGVEIKMNLTKEKFDFNFKINTIDLGPSNLNVGQRVVIQPKSYRKAIPETNMTSINSNIPYGNLSTYNYLSLPNSDLGSRITGLIKKYNPKHEDKIKKIDEALDLAESRSKVVSLAASEMGDFNKFKGGNKIRSKTPFGDNNSINNLGQSINVNVNDLAKTYGTVIVPRNVSFAKNLIDNYEGNSLQSKKYERKKNNELNISQAINDYNSYKNQEKRKLRNSKSPTSLASSRFNLRESQFGIRPNGVRGRNVPLNLLEIFSNTEVGALSLKFTKFNNPVTIDNLSLQIGTIRINMFVNYLLDILRILSEYKKATNTPKIATSGGDFSPEGQKILELQEYIYNYLLKKIPDCEKTDSMNEYMEYLRKEISSKKRFSSKPEHFGINQIFSFFPKGFEFHFDYENIEIVAYDKNNSVSSKVIVPSNEIILNLTVTKIFIKLLDLEVEITDLNKCETIIEQLKDLAKDKFKVVQIVIEPCYKEIKYGLEPLLKDQSIEYKEILKNRNLINNNIYNNQSPPQMKQTEENIEQDDNEEENIEINSSVEKQSMAKKDDEEEENRKYQEQQELLRKQKEQQILLQRQKEQQLLLQKQKEQQLLIQKQKEQQELLKQQQQQLLLQKQKEQQELLKNQQQQLLIQKQKEQQELLKKQQQQFLIQKQKEQEELLKKQQQQMLIQKQQQEKEKENQILQQKQKENLIKQQQLERNKKLILLKKQQQQRRENELKQNVKQNVKQSQKMQQEKIPKNRDIEEQKLSQMQYQQKQKNLKNVKNKNNNMKSSKQSSKKSIISNKKSQISKNNENEEDDEKIPEDTVVNRKFNSENNTNSQIGKQNNLSQKAVTGVNHLVLNPQIQQYISYNNGSSMLQNQNLSNTNYDISIPNINNSGYAYQNSQPSPYIMMGNNSQIIGNSNNNYELYNNTVGYV